MSNPARQRRRRPLLTVGMILGWLLAALGLGIGVPQASASTTGIYPPWSGTGLIEDSWDDDTYFFDARAGDVIEVEVAGMGGKDVEVSLSGPTGHLGSAGTFMGGRAFIIRTATADGRHEVEVEAALLEKLPISYSISVYFVSRGTTTTTTQPPTTTTTLHPPTTTTSRTTTTTTAQTTTTIVQRPGFPQMPPNQWFSDVPPSHPYYVQISSLGKADIVDGYFLGFRPDENVTRQQFAKMMVLAGGYPVSTGDVCPFADVQKTSGDDLYPDHYVAVCAAQGITEGKTAARFAPYDNLTRAQLFTMVARAANLPQPPAGYTPPFGNFSVTQYSWARKASYAGLLDGLLGIDAGGYNFWANATRGEVSAILYNLMGYWGNGGGTP